MKEMVEQINLYRKALDFALSAENKDRIKSVQASLDMGVGDIKCKVEDLETKLDNSMKDVKELTETIQQLIRSKEHDTDRKEEAVQKTSKQIEKEQDTIHRRAMQCMRTRAASLHDEEDIDGNEEDPKFHRLLQRHLLSKCHVPVIYFIQLQ